MSRWTFPEAVAANPLFGLRPSGLGNINAWTQISGIRTTSEPSRHPISVVHPDGTIYVIFNYMTDIDADGGVGTYTPSSYIDSFVATARDTRIRLYKSTDGGVNFTGWNGGDGVVNTYVSGRGSHNYATCCMDRSGNIHMIFPLSITEDVPEYDSLRSNITYRKLDPVTNTLGPQTILFTFPTTSRYEDPTRQNMWLVCDCANVLRIYWQTTDRASPSEAGTERIYVLKSSDEGTTWEGPTLVYENTFPDTTVRAIGNIGTVTVDQMGAILMIFDADVYDDPPVYTRKDGMIFLRIVNDVIVQGTSILETPDNWRPDEYNPTLVVDSNNTYHLVARIPIGAVSPYVWKQYYYRSTDLGVTFSRTEIQTYARDGIQRDGFNHILFVDANNRLDLIYTDLLMPTVCSATANQMVIDHRSSTDGGDTWSVSDRLYTLDTALNSVDTRLTTVLFRGGQNTWHKENYLAHWFWAHPRTSTMCPPSPLPAPWILGGNTYFDTVGVDGLTIPNSSCAIGKIICGPVDSGCPRTASDIEWTDAPRGPMQRDRTAPNSRYRMYISGGTINIEGA